MNKAIRDDLDAYQKAMRDGERHIKYSMFLVKVSIVLWVGIIGWVIFG